MVNRIAGGVGGLVFLYFAVFTAWYIWTDPFMKRQRTFDKMIHDLSVTRRTQLPLDFEDLLP